MEADGGGQGLEDDGLAMVVSFLGLVAWVPAQAVAQNDGRDALLAAVVQNAWVPAVAAARTGWLPAPGMLVVEGDDARAVALRHGWIRPSMPVALEVGWVQGQAGAPAVTALYLISLYLPAQEVARCRVICRLWRDITATEVFHRRHRDHRSRAPMPLFFFADQDYVGFALRAVDIRDRVSRPLLRFNQPSGHTVARIRGSCAGILLISFHDRLYACNPCTRRWRDLPPLHVHHDIIGFYVTTGLGGFGCKVLYQYHGREDSACAYWILTVGTAPPERRCIGRPGPVELDLVLSRWISCYYNLPPVLFLDCLHWLPQSSQDNRDILMFDTIAETFSMIPPPSIQVGGQDNSVVGLQLFEFDQHLAMTVISPAITLDVWVRSNITQLWSRRYCIRLAPVLQPNDFFAVAQDRNVLVPCMRTLLQYDSLGAELQRYQLANHFTLLAERHTIEESLLLHPSILLPAVDGEPPFFQNQY
ncbi:unnamed protein product [Alopecurus aequalis]